MTRKLTALILAARLQDFQFVPMSAPANLEFVPKLMAARGRAHLCDGVQGLLSDKIARLACVMHTSLARLILFTLVCMDVSLFEQSSPFGLGLATAVFLFFTLGISIIAASDRSTTRHVLANNVIIALHAAQTSPQNRTGNARHHGATRKEPKL